MSIVAVVNPDFSVRCHNRSNHRSVDKQENKVCNKLFAKDCVAVQIFPIKEFEERRSSPGNTGFCREGAKYFSTYYH
jgi:hypothetical protein